jgi:hypothetical protein
MKLIPRKSQMISRKLLLKEKEINTVEKAIRTQFKDDVFKIKNIDNIYKTLKFKHGNLLTRLSKNYKELTVVLVSVSLKKFKYQEYLDNLEKVIYFNTCHRELKRTKDKFEIQKNELKNKNTKLQNQIKFINNKIISMLDDIEDSMNKIIDDTDLLINSLDFTSLMEFENHKKCKKKLLDEFGVIDFIQAVENSDLAYNKEEIVGIFKKRYFKLFLESTLFGKDFYDYSRQLHDKDINVFREYDKKSRKIAAIRIKDKLIKNMPNITGFNNRNDGEIGILKRELKKKKDYFQHEN